MAVTLRLRRMGRKKRPIWAVVAADRRKPRDGRIVEDLGRYHPLEEPAQVTLNEERVLYWLRQGAQPSDTVRSMLSKRGLLLKLHLQRKEVSEEEIEKAVQAHREAALADGEAKISAADRRIQAMEDERTRVAKEEEEARKEAEAAAKKKAEEKKAAAKKAKEEAAAAEAQEAEAETSETEEPEAAAVEAEAPATEEAGESSEDKSTAAEASEEEAEPKAVAEEEPAAEAEEEKSAPEAEKKGKKTK